MAQPRPERVSIDYILKLVDELSPEEHDKLTEEIKLQWLRRALKEGEESLKKDGGIPAEVVLEELQQRAEKRLRKNES